MLSDTEAEALANQMLRRTSRGMMFSVDPIVDEPDQTPPRPARKKTAKDVINQAIKEGKSLKEILGGFKALKLLEQMKTTDQVNDEEAEQIVNRQLRLSNDTPPGLQSFLASCSPKQRQRYQNLCERRGPLERQSKSADIDTMLDMMEKNLENMERRQGF